jgi:hypothetical protein
MKVSETLRRAIEESEQTRAEISRSTGISEAVLSRFVRGITAISTANADTLAQHLGLILVHRPGGKRPKKGD